MVPAATLLSFRYQMIVLGMDRHPASRGQDVLHRRNHLIIVVQEYVPRGRPHEQLESDHQRRQHPRVDPRGDRCEQPVVGDRLAADDRLLLLQRTHVDDGGRRVRHVEDAGHARMDGGQRPCAEILLLRHPGIAEMHMRVGECRQEDPAGSEIDPALPAGNAASDGGYPSFLGHPHLGISQSAVDEGPSLEHRVDIVHGAFE